MNDSFFDAKSIAVIGASNDRTKVGWQVLENLMKSHFKGKLFPINLKAKSIASIKAYPSVLDVPEKIDLAVVVIPAPVVPAVVKECVQKQIPYVLVISAGFAEVGPRGKRITEEVLSVVKGSNTKLIGPNCLGIINSSTGLNATFAASQVEPGSIGLVLQSGAIGSAVLDWASQQGIGISKFVSLGNKFMLNEIDALNILAKDRDTKVIGLYLEDFSNASAFLSLSREIGLKKPIVVLKGGLTDSGRHAAESHTAALAASSDLTLSVFRQGNLIFAENISEFLYLIYILSIVSLDKIQSNNSLAIVSNAGGPGILAADAASKNDLILTEPGAWQEWKLKRLLDSYASLTNPFDLGGDADALRYKKVLDWIVKGSTYTNIMVIVTPQSMTIPEDIAKNVIELKASNKLIVTCLIGGQRMDAAKQALKKAALPYFSDPFMAARVLSKIYQYNKNLKEGLNIVRNQENKLGITNKGILSLAQAYKIPFVVTEVCLESRELVRAAEKMRFPVAIKTAKDVAHRARANKVRLNIYDKNALQISAKEIGFPLMVQKMVNSPHELIVGAKRDPVFGISILFGQGGVYVEEEKDINIRVLPLTERDLDEMIQETKVWERIKGLKVKKQIKDVILKVADIMQDNPDFETLDINPLKVMEEKIIAVDFKVKRKNE